MTPAPAPDARAAVELSDEQIARLARDNALDVELYAFAAALAAERTRMAHTAVRAHRQVQSADVITSMYTYRGLHLKLGT